MIEPKLDSSLPPSVVANTHDHHSTHPTLNNNNHTPKRCRQKISSRDCRWNDTLRAGSSRRPTAPRSLFRSRTGSQRTRPDPHAPESISYWSVVKYRVYIGNYHTHLTPLTHPPRIAADEMWHFYGGDSLTVVVIDGQEPTRNAHLHRLGNRLDRGELPQLVVPGGCWFGAYLDVNSGDAGYSFVGCTVAPGFDFQDFELADVSTLTAQFPLARDIIHQLGPK